MNIFFILIYRNKYKKNKCILAYKLNIAINMANKCKKYAIVIGNDGLGDMISYYGIVKYLSSMYKVVLVACETRNYDNMKYLYEHDNIKLYVFNNVISTNLYEFYQCMMKNKDFYDVYPLGNYGAIRLDLKKYTKTLPNNITKKIIHDYPISYYEDANMPIEYLTEYFSFTYPKEILDIYDELFQNYDKYIVFHQKGSNVPLIDFVSYQKIDINNVLTIDVNQNLYKSDHKFFNIAQKFVNLPSIIFYSKLLESASSLYLIDSCLHALALIIDVSKANPKICYQRESRFNYGFKKFDYFHLIFYQK
jgi:mRNA-degrading endonuclease HigB of HigAB toxin-antitoxin module